MSPWGITAGPDGNVWFTEYFGDVIGRITPTGTITELPTPTQFSHPNEICQGPNGKLWFTESGVEQIGKLTP